MADDSVELVIAVDVSGFVDAMRAAARTIRRTDVRLRRFTWATGRGSTARAAYRAKTRRRNRRG